MPFDKLVRAVEHSRVRADIQERVEVDNCLVDECTVNKLKVAPVIALYPKRVLKVPFGDGDLELIQSARRFFSEMCNKSCWSSVIDATDFFSRFEAWRLDDARRSKALLKSSIERQLRRLPHIIRRGDKEETVLKVECMVKDFKLVCEDAMEMLEFADCKELSLFYVLKA